MLVVGSDYEQGPSLDPSTGPPLDSERRALHWRSIPQCGRAQRGRNPLHPGGNGGIIRCPRESSVDGPGDFEVRYIYSRNSRCARYVLNAVVGHYCGHALGQNVVSSRHHIYFPILLHYGWNYL